LAPKFELSRNCCGLLVNNSDLDNRTKTVSKNIHSRFSSLLRLKGVMSEGTPVAMPRFAKLGQRLSSPVADSSKSFWSTKLVTDNYAVWTRLYPVLSTWTRCDKWESNWTFGCQTYKWKVTDDPLLGFGISDGVR